MRGSRSPTYERGLRRVAELGGAGARRERDAATVRPSSRPQAASTLAFTWSCPMPRLPRGHPVAALAAGGRATMVAMDVTGVELELTATVSGNDPSSAGAARLRSNGCP